MAEIFKVNDQATLVILVGDFDSAFWECFIQVVEERLELMFGDEGDDIAVIGGDVVAVVCQSLVEKSLELESDNDTYRSQSRA